MYKVALWGAGEGYNLFTSLHGHSLVNVVAIVDKERGLIRNIDGIPLISPMELIDGVQYDFIVVTVINERTYNEIIEEAVAMGISRD